VISPERLAQIQALLSGITPGKWKLSYGLLGTLRMNIVREAVADETVIAYVPLPLAWRSGTTEQERLGRAAELKLTALARELNRLCDVVEAAESVTAARKAEALENEEQRWIDLTCYYRNLAIRLGAKPTEMQSKFDRQLCEKGLNEEAIEEVDRSRTDNEDIWADLEKMERVVKAARKICAFDDGFGFGGYSPHECVFCHVHIRNVEEGSNEHDRECEFGALVDALAALDATEAT
jgi:hypothetical protein